MRGSHSPQACPSREPPCHALYTQGALGRVAFYRGTFALQEALFGVENGDEEAFRAGIAPYM